MTTYKYRLYPGRSQETSLVSWLESCRFLYNLLLEERKNSWEKNKKNLSLYDQCNSLPKLKRKYPELKKIHSQVLQNTAVRLDLAFKAFFRRIRQGEKPGYPRFKSKHRYDNICFPQVIQECIEDNFVWLPKFGKVEFIKHRKILGKIKNIMVKRSLSGKWFLYVVTDHVEKENFGKTEKENVGLDVGIECFAMLSDGTRIENPRFFEIEQKELAKKQRKLEKLKKAEKPVKTTKLAITKIHEKIVNKRHNFCFQTANSLLKKYRNIYVEDIEINKLIQKKWCSKQICDAAWGNFLNILVYKAECADRKVEKVNPAYTSQTCSQCGTRTIHELKDRVFKCKCGLQLNRDLNAALNILTLGTKSFKNTLGTQSFGSQEL